MSSILSVQNLNKSFGNKHVLHDVSFDIEKGHIVGLVGPNGAGKSTIMKTMLGLFNFQSGTIKVDGQTVTPMKHEALSKVGALVEHPGIYPFLTGWDHLQLFADGDHQLIHIQKIISQLNMDSYIKRKTKGYSLGMKQKLGIALALVNFPELVILDEPMNGLDPESIKDLRDLIISETQQGATFLISSHILSELQRLAQDLLIIDQGRIVETTTMHDLLASQGKQTIMLMTNDDKRARDVLKKARFKMTADPRIEVVATDDSTMPRVLKTLVQANIDILDVSRLEGNLESSLLEVLKQNRIQQKLAMERAE
ncbi:ABC transporter ATP-binding protein [Secundilactobacillus folii]|uniref:ATP-binding cassette domain-containing protein n=1 Tax=Secundilactobacillus folii TaxID=2678357 RepID=A0A7X2XX32_9LACO|nr:ATP-binding cassette domain-containing protein [Secundilactobacillus folii]MTV82705.1 ATP-binding cassette domain-containing protein [Secundilactobacillus folii]